MANFTYFVQFDVYLLSADNKILVKSTQGHIHVNNNNNLITFPCLCFLYYFLIQLQGLAREAGHLVLEVKIASGVYEMCK